MALLAKVLREARPDPSSSGAQAVMQAASSSAMLAGVGGAVDVLA